jgi:hypothetical protein
VSSDHVYHTRKRDLEIVPQETVYETYRLKGGTGSYTPRAIRHQITGREWTTTRDNPNWHLFTRTQRKVREGESSYANALEFVSRQDLGGEFESVKKRVVSTPDENRKVHLYYEDRYTHYQYDGPWYARAVNIGPDDILFPAVPDPSTLRREMIVQGTTAIARTIPTNPVSGAAVFLGELREGLPSIPGQALLGRKGTPSGLASEYLNLEFGIKPMISDLMKFREAARNSKEIVEQLRRDSGRVVRRRYRFPVKRVVDPPEVYPHGWGGAPSLVTSWGYKTTGKLTKTRTTTVRDWFSGAYTYYYNESDRALRVFGYTEQELNRLFGLRITPEVLWELSPWSWLVDWKSNVGDVIHNMSAFSRDGLVLKYGYMMRHMTITDSYLLEGAVLRDGTSGPLRQDFITEVKKRVVATPYGFGLDPDAFTPRQWAILTALGVSRGGRK